MGDDKLAVQGFSPSVGGSQTSSQRERSVFCFLGSNWEPEKLLKQRWTAYWAVLRDDIKTVTEV